MRKKIMALGLAAIALAPLAAITSASPPEGVTRTEIASGAYKRFKVRTAPTSPIEVRARTKTPVAFVVRKHEYAIGSHTGWHNHPGPVFITVTKGTLTYYRYGDRECTPHVVHAGQGFVDNGRGHIVRNESGAVAEDVSVILGPVGGEVRSERDAPGPHCDF